MNKNYIIYVIQSILIYNAMCAGWKVNILGNKKFEMIKDIDSSNLQQNINVRDIINQLLQIITSD